MDPINLLLVFAIIIVSGLGFVLLFHGRRNIISLVYVANILVSLWWIWSMFFYRAAGPLDILTWTKILYVSATFIASTFLYFTYCFPEPERQKLRSRFFVFFGINAAIVALVAGTSTIIESVQLVSVGENRINFGVLYPLYVVYILGYFLYAFYRLFHKYFGAKHEGHKKQIILLLAGYMLTAFTAFVTNLLLPWFGVFTLNWVGQVSGVFMVSFATYAILKYRLFSARLISTEFLVFTLWVFLLIRTLLSSSQQEQIINLGLLSLAVGTGMFLIKSIVKDVQIRERLEHIANRLAATNRRLKELDRQKSEFLSVASHQFRAPLTAIKGYSSLLLDNSYDTLPKELKEPTQRIFESSKNLETIVEDFLNVSRIEQGRMEYHKAPLHLNTMLESIVNEYEKTAEKKGVEVALVLPDDAMYILADEDKVRHVFVNLFDNALKYTRKGSVTVTARREGDQIHTIIKDTGIGIPENALDDLFGEFKRAPNANRVNVMGTGLGLFVAKQIVKAHNGRIWAESKGEGEGSKFHVVLPRAEQGTSNNNTHHA